MIPAFLAVVLAALPLGAGAQDASAGYAKIKPSLARITWVDGTQQGSGTAFVVASSERTSLLLGVARFSAAAKALRAYVGGSDLGVPAVVVARADDIALLRVDLGQLRPVTFCTPGTAPVEGNEIAVAGFAAAGGLGPTAFGMPGNLPRLRFPASVASLFDQGHLIEIANIAVDDQLLGAPVFNPVTGEVVGQIIAHGNQPHGGTALAVSAPAVLLQFLSEHHVATIP